MIDIDEFKSINDTYGHNVGDVGIQSFATSLRQQPRKNDIAGCLGGEEFAVMLSSAKLPDTAPFSRRLQKRLSDRPVLLDGPLYQAKYLGRNRIEIAVSKKSL